MIPKRCILLLAGIPATGKSSFGSYLARLHSFAHYDLECYPHGWPHPELKPQWDSSRARFVKALQKIHSRTALDWGFPVTCLPWVRELQDAGTRLIWFTGDEARARETFIARGGIDVQKFDDQLMAIHEARLPSSLQCTRIAVLSEKSVLKEPAAIAQEIFGE
jgi:hypothetical protein